MLVCGIDTETTGLDTKNDLIIEMACVLFDAITWEPSLIFQTFITHPNMPPLSDTIKNLTHITDEMLLDQADPVDAFFNLENFTNPVVGFVAHNASFDYEMIINNAKKIPYDLSNEFLKKPWVCSKSDVSLHATKKCTKLSHLAVDYGLKVDGSKLHRAVDDVLLMGEMLAKTGKTYEDILAWRVEPWVYIEATNVQKPWLDGGASIKKVKEEGFSWEKVYGTDSPVFQKTWVKRVKRSEYQDELARPSEFKRVRISTT